MVFRASWTNLSRTAVGALAIIFILLFFATTPTFHHCIHTIKDRPEYQNLYNEVSALGGFLRHGRIVLACESVALDKHNGLLTLIATAVIAWFTVSLTVATKGLQEASTTQSGDMQKSIAEAARAANAMEGVATGIASTVANNKIIMENQRDFWSRQMRAYISADNGDHVRQSQRWRFEFRVNLANNGNTPANNILILSKCEVRVGEIPEGFDFSVARIGEPNATTMFPRQTKFHRHIFNRKCTITEMRDLLKGKASFHLWGRISYSDAFGIEHYTNFSYLIVMPTNKRGAPFWRTTDQHNDAT